MNAWTWLLQRVSAIFLLSLVGVHIWRVHVARITTLDVVILRSELLIFVVLDLLLLVVGIFHGLNGLYSVLVDLGLKDKAAVATIISLGMAGTGCLGVGGYALFRFIS
ncbi:MAG: hypothetical protein ACE5LA_04415 [Dehalococcoidales bacterium]